MKTDVRRSTCASLKRYTHSSATRRRLEWQVVCCNSNQTRLEAISSNLPERRGGREARGAAEEHIQAALTRPSTTQRLAALQYNKTNEAERKEALFFLICQHSGRHAQQRACHLWRNDLLHVRDLRKTNTPLGCPGRQRVPKKAPGRADLRRTFPESTAFSVSPGTPFAFPGHFSHPSLLLPSSSATSTHSRGIFGRHLSLPPSLQPFLLYSVSATLHTARSFFLVSSHADLSSVYLGLCVLTYCGVHHEHPSAGCWPGESPR